MINTNLVDDFISYMKSNKGSPETTVREYYYNLREFLRYMLAKKNSLNIEFEDIDISLADENFIKTINKKDIYSFISYLSNVKKNSNRTKYRKISAIRTFFKYLSTNIDVIEFNPAKDIEMPKIEKRMPVYLELEDAKKLLESVIKYNEKKKDKNSEIRKYRDYCMITLFLNCGMRLSELSGINLDDLNDNKLIRIIGKGSKERIAYLNEACIIAIENYLKYRPNVKDNALFLSNRNTRITNRQIQRIIEKYLQIAGLDTEKYSVHKLRHTAATLMYKYGGADIRSLQEILGHESVTTTQIYTHVDNENLRQTLDSNPLSQVDYSNK